jgi:hypothetical protein
VHGGNPIAVNKYHIISNNSNKITKNIEEFYRIKKKKENRGQEMLENWEQIIELGTSLIEYFLNLRITR